MYLGSDDGLETELAPAAGFALAMVKAGKLRRYISWKTVTGMARVPMGMAQAVGVVRTFSPAGSLYEWWICSGSGRPGCRIEWCALADAPGGCAAELVEQNDCATGDAHLGGFCGLDGSTPQRARRCAWVIRCGNLYWMSARPRRNRRVRRLAYATAWPLLLVTGGKPGGKAPQSTVVCVHLPELLAHCQVLQISGRGLFEETRELCESRLTDVDEVVRRRYRLEAYLDAEMPIALQAADAGALPGRCGDVE